MIARNETRMISADPKTVDVQVGFDLTPRNTLGLAAKARFGALVKEADEIEPLVRFAESEQLPLVVLGGGSNVVLGPEIEAVIAVFVSKGRKIERRDDGSILLTAQAGEDWPDLVRWSVEQGFGGLENLAGIPGTVGAAPVQNIGAYGVELADRFEALTAFDRVEKRFCVFRKADCRFRYRQSAFKDEPGRYIIAEVTFRLPGDWRPILGYSGLDRLPETADPKTIMERVLALRGGKLPDWRLIGNAGSFFHNPIVSQDVADGIEGVPKYPQADGAVKLSAGWLIESCGLKGYRSGKAGVYENHALILVNHGQADANDIDALSRIIRTAVEDRYGIVLHQEPLDIR
ncbi:UDP-N-acetylmuramate dehydrogenase [Fulvimarina sp. MAC3]|uniref:UDP-N-acetylmuramate dehydrogenase n=1 Tax=Fulvimarina sp. MAC3 TaxID=3148887 RepID=UPI0031FDB6FA